MFRDGERIEGVVFETKSGPLVIRAPMRRRQIGEFVKRLHVQGRWPGRKLVEAEARRHGFSLMQRDYLQVYRLIVEAM